MNNVYMYSFKDKKLKLSPCQKCGIYCETAPLKSSSPTTQCFYYFFLNLVSAQNKQGDKCSIIWYIVQNNNECYSYHTEQANSPTFTYPRDKLDIVINSKKCKNMMHKLSVRVVSVHHI